MPTITHHNGVHIMEDRDRLAAGVRMAISFMSGSGSQAEVARRLGISSNPLSRWTTGSSTPSASNLTRLSRLSGMSVDDILNGRYPAATN